MKSILATTDFSPSSWNAVQYAARLAQDLNTKLILLHATHIPVVSDSFFDMGITLEELEKTDKEQMQAMNEKLAAKFPELKLEKKVKIGFTTELIREQVRKGEVGLVVMGIAHMDKFTEVVFGSTSTALAGHVSCPVMIVPEGAKYRPLKKIAFAFDQKHVPTGTGLREVKEMKGVFESEVHYVHVMDSPFGAKDSDALKPVFKLFGDKAPKLHFLNAIPGQTVEIIHDWVRRFRANAVVMISRGHNLFWLMFNERTTKKMAFHTKVPLIVVPENKRS